MADVLIRDVPEDVHRELKDRARAAGVSLQAYITMVLSLHTARPSMTDWLAQLHALPAVRTTLTGADAVAAAREDLP